MHASARVSAVCGGACCRFRKRNMTRAEKVERVAALKARIEGAEALLLAEYRGLTVADITDLRRSLAEGGARFSVVKNTLMRRAAVDAAMAELEQLFDGPTAVAFVAGDPVAAAKKVVDASKKYPTLVLKGGWMEGRLLSAEEATSLADLESREVMLSKIAGLLKNEMSRAASMFASAQSRFLSLLEAYREKLPGEAEVAPAEPAPEAEPASEEAPPAAESPSADEAPPAEETPSADETPPEETSSAQEAPAAEETTEFASEAPGPDDGAKEE
jgi:large subunit ribosomal protein L10